MSQKYEIEIQANSKDAQKELDRLNDTLDEQKQILIELEKELYEVERIQKKTSKTNLAAQRSLTKQADHLTDSIKDQRISLKELSLEQSNATDTVKGLNSENVESSNTIMLLDQVTGGWAGTIEQGYQALGEMGRNLKNVTKAQLRMNAAMLLNPVVLITAGVVGLTAAFSKYLSVMTDGVVSTTESFFNLVKSLGNPFKFAALQAETYAKNLEKVKDAQDELDLERAIAVLGAFGQQTIDQEIQLAELKLKKLVEGEEGYTEAETALLVLRARKSKEAGELVAKNYMEARNKTLADLQLQWQLQQEAEDFQKAFYEQMGEEAGTTFAEAFTKAQLPDEFDPDSVAILEEFDDDPANDPELTALVEKGKLMAAERERQDEVVKSARAGMLDNLIGMVGAESKVGKALLVAKGIQQAQELAMEVGKTVAFSTQAAARSMVAVAEGTAQTAKIGFPQNIPMLIGYAAQGAGIIMSIKSALSSAKAPTSSIDGMSGGRGASAPPEFNIVGASETNQLAQSIGQNEQQPVKAFVVSNEITNAQSLERNIIEGASIG